MAGTTTLYQQTVNISVDYLGPAGERFMRRQITTHLSKEPEDLDKHDIDELVHWIQLTLALLTNDKEVITAFMERLQKLAADHDQPRKTVRAAR